MSCTPLMEKGAIIGWVCSRGERQAEACYLCGKPAIRLCDYEDASGSCDRPLCRRHSHHTGADTDYCPEHFKMLSKLQTRIGGV